MSKRIVFLGTMIVLAIAGYFVWRNASQVSLATQALERARAAETEARPIVNELATSKQVAENARAPAAPLPIATVSPSHAPKGATLNVLVVSKETRRPLAGVRVSLQSEEPEPAGKWVDAPGAHGTIEAIPITGADGRVDFDAPAGGAMNVSGHVQDGSAGYANTDVAALAPGETREIVLEMPTGDDMQFCGRVVDRETEQPVVGARVHISQVAPDPGSKSRKTDAGGGFQVSLASWRAPQLQITAEGYALTFVVPQKAHDTPQNALVIRLDRAATLRVHLQQVSGAPVGGANVALGTKGYEITQPHDATLFGGFTENDWSVRATTDANGRAELSGLPPGVPIAADVRRDQVILYTEPDAIVLKPGEVRDVEWKIGAGCVVRGRVVDQDDKAVVRCTLWLMRPTSKHAVFFPEYVGDKAASCRTDSEGRFVFPDVAAGAWWIGPANEHHSFEPPKPDLVAPLAEVIEISDVETQRDLEIRVDRGLYIRGRVLDPSGEQPPYAYLMARRPETHLIAYLNLNHASEFAIGPLAHGRYLVAANAQGLYCKSEEVACDAGASDIVLRLKSGGTISGTVIDGETNQPTVAEITYSSALKPDSGWGRMQTERDGTFTLRGLEPDVYSIVAGDSRDRFGFARPITANVGEEARGVVITLAAGARVRVRYTGEEAHGQCFLRSCGAVIGVDDIQSGTAREFSVPAGELTLVLRLVDADRKIERKLEIAAGETKEVVFDKDSR